MNKTIAWVMLGLGMVIGVCVQGAYHSIQPNYEVHNHPVRVEYQEVPTYIYPGSSIKKIIEITDRLHLLNNVSEHGYNCQNISRDFKKEMDSQGIPVRLVAGFKTEEQIEGHMWAEITLQYDPMIKKFQDNWKQFPIEYKMRFEVE